MNERAARRRAEHDRDKAEQLLQRAARSTDPEVAERLRYQAEQLKIRSKAALRDEPQDEPGDVREQHPS